MAKYEVIIEEIVSQDFIEIPEKNGQPPSNKEILNIAEKLYKSGVLVLDPGELIEHTIFINRKICEEESI